MRKRERDEQGVGAPDTTPKKLRESEESPSSSTSAASHKAASSGSVNEPLPAGQSMQVDPAQAPPRRGLHGRTWDFAATSSATRKPISLSKTKKPVLPSTSQADTSPSTSAASPKAASSGSAKEPLPAASSMQVDPAQVPPRRGLHGRNWDFAPARTTSRKPISLSKTKKPVLPSTSQAGTSPSTSTPANASTVDTTRPEQLQASVARLNQRNYMSRSSQGQAEGSSSQASNSLRGQTGGSSSSQGQAKGSSSHAGSPLRGQAEGSSSHATSSSDPNAQSSSSHATATSWDATTSLPFSITIGDLLRIHLSEQQDSSEAYATAFHELQKSSFNESMENCKRELMRHKLGVCSGTLSDVLNGTSAAHGVAIKHLDATIAPKGHLLLLCLCHAFNIKAYVFSTRKHPVIISPSAEPAASTVALLVHTDSYVQKTTWHSLQYKTGFTTPQPVLPCPEDAIIATKKPQDGEQASGSSRATRARHTLGGSQDELIQSQLRDLCFPIFRSRWDAFRSANGTGTIADFKETVSVKSFPQGVIATAQRNIASQMRQDGRGADVSKNPTWLSSKVNSWKSRKKNPVHLMALLFDEFVKIVTEEQEQEQESPSEESPSEENESDAGEEDAGDDASDDASGQGDGGASEAQGGGQRVQVKEYRVVATSLKRVIKPGFDYPLLLQRLEGLQHSCHQAIYGLSQCIDVLVGMIMAGECYTGDRPLEYFDYASIDLDGRGIGRDQERMAMLGPIDENAAKLFNFEGFYKVLCAVVGGKHLDKHKAENPILEQVSSRLPQADHAEFVCGPWIQDACRRFLTNFTNMWSPSSCSGDLRVVMELLLRVHLCSKRFFKPKPDSKKKKKKKKGKNKASPSNNYNMNELFWALVSKNPKRRVIDSLRNRLFVASPAAAAAAAAAAEPSSTPPIISDAAPEVAPEEASADPSPVVVDDDSDPEEDEDDATELLLLVESADLPAKDIRALVAVACNLCQSAEHPTLITKHHVKEKLYHDKQESIPPAALEVAAELITAVRALTPKKDQPFSVASWFQMRALRNTLVEFAADKTKRRVIKLTVAKERDTGDRDAVRIDSAALYHLFSRDHDLYASDGTTKFTTIHAVHTEEQQLSLWNNLFKVNHVTRELAKQKLMFAGYLMFVNQYDVQFSGYRMIVQTQEPSQVQPAPSAVDANTKQAHKQAVRVLTNEIKALRQQYTAMSKELKKLEIARMAAGNRSRKYEALHKKRDAVLYTALRRARQAFNQVHMSMSRLQRQILDKQSEMYMLNKQINGQPTPQPDPPANPSLMSTVAKPNTIVQGIDPGVVTTASGMATTTACLLAHVNRFQAISDHRLVPHPKDTARAFSLTASMVNTATLANQHRRSREKKTPTVKRKQKNRITRKSRLKKYYQRKVAHDRVGGKEQPCVTFTGNWSGSATYIKGHARRSTRPYYKQLAALEKDLVLSVDEYKSTVVCSSCFERTSKQPHVRDGKLKRIPGAVICYNVECPRRLTTRATTTNRDGNGALNIALIGFSRVASTDGLPLPPFRRSQQSNKYTLSPLFPAHQLHGEEGLPTLRGDLL